jgi:hypothetical protein
LNHRDAGTGSEKSVVKNSCRLSLWLRASVVIFALLPSVLLACPRCVDATPYKTGMQLAVAVLLPIPFVLAYGLYRWIQNESKTDSSEI